MEEHLSKVQSEKDYCLIEKQVNQNSYEMSSGQKRIYFIDKMQEENITYNFARMMRIKGLPDLKKLQAALHQVIMRHEILRTIFVTEDGKLLQKVQDVVHIPLEYEEIEHDNSIKLFEEFIVPFQLDKAPLIRVKILKTNANEMILMLDMHHIITDDISTHIFLRDLTRFYNGETLNTLELHYKDYSVWQNKQNFDVQKKYWLDEFSGEIPVVDLKTDFIRPQIKTYNGNHFTTIINQQQKEKIKDLCKENDVSEYVFLLSVFMLLLNRYSRQNEIIVGSPIWGRVHPETEDMMGMFANYLAIKGQLADNINFNEFLSQMKVKYDNAVKNQEYPFDELIENLKLVRDLSRNPLFDIMFVLEEQSEMEYQMGDITLTPIHYESRSSKLDLMVIVKKIKGEYVLNWEYNTDLFKQKTVERMGEHFQQLLISVLDGTNREISRFNLLTVEEKQLLDKFNQTKTNYPGNKTIIELFEEQVERVPDNIAVEFEGNTLTYKELNQRANFIGDELRKLGAKPDEVIGIVTKKSLEMLVGIYGILKSGAAYMPIDPEYPVDRIKYMYENSGSKILVVGPQGEDAANLLNGIEVLRMANLNGKKEKNLECLSKPEHLAYVIYTSGSTGKPKGVMVENRGVVNVSSWYQQQGLVLENSIVMQNYNYVFDASIAEIFPAGLIGAKLLLLTETQKNDPRELLELLPGKQLSLIPSMFRMILEYAETHNQKNGLNQFDKIYLGAEALPFDLLEKYRELTGNNLEGLYNIYGPTEVTDTVVTYNLSELTGRGIVPIGKPLSNLRAYILNGSNLCGIGIPGELCIAGDGVSRGYLNNPELTKRSFIDNPYQKGEIIYRTGDLARWMEDGNIEYLGRIDAQVKVRGFRIELGEVESRIREIESINDAAVTAIEENGIKFLSAYIVSNQKMEAGKVKAQLREMLPDYMVPSYIVQLENFPLNHNGKLDRKALPKPIILAEQEYVKPRNEIEESVVEVFKEILGAERIGIKDNFFDLGGDSIKAIRIVSRLREKGYNTNVMSIMNGKTADNVGRGLTRIEFDYSDNSEVVGKVMLTPIQKEFFDSKLNVPEHYNQSYVLKSAESIDVNHLQEALKAIAVHHDMLRAVYDGEEQRVLSTEESRLFELTCFDYIDLDNQDEVDCLIDKQSNKIQSSISLTKGPLLKVGLFHTKYQDYLVICIHHLVVDGVSWRIIVEDLVKGYKVAKEGQNIVLPAKTTSFQKWSKALRNYRDSYLLEKEVPYWIDMEKQVLESKFNNLLQTNNSGFTKLGLSLSEENTNNLLQKSRKAYQTEINDLLLTALFRAVYQTSGQGTVSVLMEGHGREMLDQPLAIDRTVGWFTSTYPVAIKEIGKTLKEDIRKTKEVLRRVPNHGLGYGVLNYFGEKVLESVLPDITFNYLGEFGQEDAAESFKISQIAHGSDIAAENSYDNDIVMKSSVVSKKFEMWITYNQAKYSSEFIELLQTNFKNQLIEVIKHCIETESSYTASDVGELNWSDKEFLQVNESFKEKGYEIERIYPLTGLQEGMLFHKMKDEQTTSYVIQSVYKLESEINEEFFQNSLELLAEKNEILRTSIVYKNVSHPRQVLLKNRKIEYRSVDLSNDIDVLEKYRVIKENDVVRGFDLENDSLFRVILVKLTKEDSYIIMSSHHIIEDGWSTSIILTDLFNFYDELYIGRSYEEILKNMVKGTRYEDYIRIIEKQDVRLGRQYWQKVLEGYDEKIGILPEGKTDLSNHEVETVKINLTEEESRKIEEVSKKHHVTVNTFIEASWGVLLQKYNNVNDVVFGKVVSGRNVQLQGIEHMAGLFINTVPVRVETKEQRFSDILLTLQQQSIDNSPYEHCPLSEIQKTSSLDGDLFDTLMEFENYYIPDSQRKHKLKILLEESREQTNYPITIFSHMINCLEIGLMYDTKKYGKSEAERIINRLKNILLSTIDNPEVYISEIDLLTTEEKNEILKFGTAKVDYPDDKTISELFEEQVEKRPDEIAIVSMNEKITYGELNGKANQLGRKLRASGVGPDDFVGIIAERKLSTIIGILGILKSGGAYLPIDPEYPSERINYILRDSKCKVLLIENSRIQKDIEDGIKIIDLSSVDLFSTKKVDNLEKINHSSRDLAYLIYTSGTSGEPKGVMIEQRSVSRLVKNTNYVDFTDVRILQTGSLTFDASTFEIWGALLNGGRLCIVDKDVLTDVALLNQILQQFNINTMFITTALYNQLISINDRIFDPLSQLLFGGEATSEEQVRKLWERNKAIKLSNVYGPTESTTFATYYPITGETLRAKTPIGKPISNTTAYVFDGGKLNGIGMPGELCLGGDGLSRGYLNSEQLTNDRYFENPYLPGERLYRTGDLVRWTFDGNIEFLGRTDEQVKIRGFRIEPGEIESGLRDIETIEDAAVTVIEKSGSKYLCGYVVSKEDINISEIKQKLSETMPDYMIPNYIIKVPILPLNRNGKVDKKALPEPDLEVASTKKYIPPRNETEICIAKGFKEVLGIEQVGIDDSFFELGGDSIKGIRIVSKLREEGYKINVRSIMKDKTVRNISLSIEKSEIQDLDNREVIGKVDLTPIQKEFFEYDLKVPNHFNQSFIFTSGERIDDDSLGQALAEIVKHHDMLRAVYQGEEQEILSISESKLYELHCFDYLHIKDQKEAYQLIDEQSNQIQASINLSDGPLLKAALFHLQENDYIMLCIHHLAVDGVSWRILIEDLGRGYRAIKEGQKVVLPIKTVSFQKWSEALGKYRESYLLRREISYWKQVEAQVSKSKLIDIAKPVGSGFTELMVYLDEENTKHLMQKAEAAYHTEINDLLLTALFRAVHQVSGQETVAVLMEGHGREQLDQPLTIDRTVGWFTSIYPVVINEIGGTLAADIRKTKELLRRIPNRGFGYSVLNHLGQPVLTGINPEITFNYLGEFGQEDREDSFKICQISHGREVSKENLFGSDIIIYGSVINKKFEVSINYNQQKYSREFMEQLQNYFKMELLAVVNHCIGAKNSFTASDFGELSWNDREFIKVEQGLTAEGHEIERIYPLTGLQEGMLFHKLENEEATSYVVQSVYQVQSILDEEMLKSSLWLLAKKHEILRTKIVYKNVSEPRQVLLKNRTIEYNSIDLSNEDDPYQTYLAIKEKDIKRGFDLENDSLLRIIVLKINEDTTYMIMNVHHIIIDGWSNSILMNDLQSFYDGLCEGKTIEELSAVVKNGIRYEDYVRFVQNKDKESARHYWKELLNGYEEKIGIRPEKNVDAAKEEAETITVNLSVEETLKLNEVSKKYEVTINTFIEATWAILLQKYNNTNDVVFGKVVSGRNVQLPGVEDMVGLFINTIPVRAQAIDGKFSEFLIAMQQQALQGNSYDDCSLSEIQNESALGRDLFETLMVFENYYIQDKKLKNNLKLNSLSGREQTNYPLTLFSEATDILAIGLMYDTSLYNKSEAERIVNYFKTILLNVLADPEIKMSEIEVLTVSEKEFIVKEFNQTKTNYPADKTIIELFEEQVDKTPDTIAVVCQQAEITYAQINKKANQLGEKLRAMGIKPDDFVGIIAERKLSTIVGISGILKAGGAYLPLDPKYPIERMNYILKDCKCKVILTTSPEAQIGIEEDIKIIDLSDPNLFLEKTVGNLIKVNQSSKDLAYLIYTSGTSGEPKGVMIEQRSVNRLVKNTNYADFTDVRILQTGSLTFDASTFEIWGALLNGGKLYIVEEDILMDISLLKETIEQCGINTMFITTALYNQLISMNDTIFDPLTQLLFGGEATSEEHVQKLWKRNKNIKLSNVYGPTESTTFATYYPITGETLRAKTPIGKPIANTTAYIFNGKNSKVLSGVGMPGELCLGGDGLSRGYLNSEKLTNDKYFDHPYQSGEKLYRTGDLVRWTSDGNIEFLGRIDEQVKIRGFRIEPGEIESGLRNLVTVDDAAVIVREESGSKYLCAYVVSKVDINVNEIKQKLSETMPDYMIPNYIMRVSDLPLNKNGKIDKNALPMPNLEARNIETYIAPENETEICLAKVFKEILGADQVGLDDSFFDLGGDSIKGIRVVSRLREEGYKINVKSIMKEKTIRKISEVIKKSVVLSVDNKEVTGHVDLTPIQKEFFNYDFKVPNHFNQSFIFESRERIDDDSLRKVLSAITKHHDMLRAIYQGENQEILPINKSKLYELKSFDYLHLEDQKEAYQLIDERSDELQASINLSEGPLLKAGLFHLKDCDYIMICVHHLVIDGVSWRIIIEDLVRGYRAVKEGKKVILPTKTTSFQKWSKALTEYRESYLLKREIPYWKAVEEQVEKSKLVDKAEATGSGFIELLVALDEENTNNLLQKSGKTYHTEINDLLLTAVFRAVHQVSGQETVAVLLEGHGREQLDQPLAIDRTVGWFTTTYPVAVTHIGKTLAEDIRKVKELLRRIPNHGLGYSVLNHLGEPVLEGANPEILFNYLGEFGQEDTEENFQMRQIPHGRDDSEQNILNSDIAMNGSVVNKKFVMSIRYNGEKYSHEFMEQLQSCFEKELFAIMNHCIGTKSSYTASDFGELSWSDQEFIKVDQELTTKGYAIERIYPLTAIQEGMLFHKLEDEEATSYVVQTVYQIESELDEEKLQLSLCLLGEKHGILRSNIIYKNVREPRRVLLKGRKIEYQSIDLSNESNPYQSYIELKEQDVRRGFDLENDSLLRVTVLKINEETSYMIMNIHHIIIDGWSSSIVMNDILEFYDELSKGRSKEELSENIEKATSYEDYVQLVQNKDEELGFQYWKELLDGYEEKIGIFSEGNIDITEEQVGSVSTNLSPELSRELKKIGKKYEVTINTFIEAAWGILLQKYNNTKDVVFGKVVSGRNMQLPGIEDMVGLFINTVPVRAEAKQEKFVDFLVSMQQQAIKGNAYDDCPLSEIQKQSHFNGNLFETMMAFENYYVQDKNKEYSLKWNLVDVREQTNYPLTLFSDISDILTIGLMYDTNKYGKAEVERMIKRLKTILQNVIKNPEIAMDDIEVLTTQETEEILVNFNSTQTDYPENKTIIELFEEQVRKKPEEIAVLSVTENITYNELNCKANQLGKKLRELGVGADDFVAIIAERELSTIIGILGILKSGAAYLPIDPNYPAERISYILKDSKCKVMLAANNKIQKSVESVAKVLDLSNTDLFSTKIVDNLEKINHSSRDLAYLIYTSGTSGEPKGVMIEQRSVSRLVKNTNYVDFTDVRILQTGSLTFDASTFEIWGSLLNGGRLCIVDKDVLTDIQLLDQTLKKFDINTMFITTALYNQLISINDQIFDPLSQLLFGGEATSEEHVRKLRERNKTLKLSNVYGPTESTTFATYYPITGETLRAKTPIGKPISNTTAYVFNGNKLSGIGMPGELCLGGDGLSRGYLNSEQLTNDRYFEHPYQPGERLYRTGDLVRWTFDGNIEFLGRIDEQVKIRGFRIEPGEIESGLRDIEPIEDAAVIVREESGSKYLCGYIVSKEDININKIKQKLSETMPDYMIPNYIMKVSALPLNKNGKIDKHALPEPDLAAATVEVYIAPRNETEACLVQVFREILGIDQIGIDDNFFDLGGDSIKAIRIISRLREEGYKINVKSIMRDKTIRKISTVTKKSVVQPKNLEEVTGTVNFTPIQKEFINKGQSVPVYFNQSFVLKSQEVIDAHMLEMVLKEIARHHDMLRAIYENDTQRILSVAESKLCELIEQDYTAISDDTELYNRIDEKSNEIQRSMNLSVGPLFKAGLFHTPDKDYIMLCAHHFVIDGISWRIIIEDLAKGYAAVKRGTKPEFPSKTISFQTWSKALTEYRESYLLKREISYWKDIELKVEEAELTVHTNDTGFSFGEKKISLSEEYTNYLLQRAGKTYHTEINDLLLTAFFRALNQTSGQKSVAVLMEGHGREPLDISLAIDRTVGWFTTTYPVATRSIGKTIRQDIREVKELLRRLPNHGIGYGVLKELGEQVLTGIKPKILFNYLGEFDQENTIENFEISNIRHGNDSSDEYVEDLEIAVNGLITNKRLHMSITYNQVKYSDQLIEQIQNNFTDQLNQVIGHCLEAPAYQTASDFGELSWSDEEFIEINEKFIGMGYEVQRIYPLTGLQEGMLFHKLQDEEATSYVVQNVYRMEGDFNEQALQKGLQLLAEKHEILRTSIVYNGVVMPRQVLLKGREVEYQSIVIDNESDPQNNSKKIIEQDLKRGFDLEKDSLMRITIIKDGEHANYFMLSFHHIILDGWCMSILMNDLYSFYDALCLGGEFEKIKNSIQKGVKYEEYVRYLENKDKKASLNYWKDLLRGYDEKIGISPVGKPDEKSAKVGTIRIRLEEEESKKLEEVGKKYEVTVNTIMEASWGILLQKYNNTDDVVFGKVVSGRNAEIQGIEEVVGLFINTVPVRVESDGMTFSELLTDLQQQALKGNAYDDCPLSEIQTASGTGFDTLLVFENYYSQDGKADHKLKLIFEESREETNFPLTLYSYLEHGLELGLIYDKSKYGKNEVERIMGRLKAILLNVTENPEMKIGR